MADTLAIGHDHLHIKHEKETFFRTSIGFWIYLMTDGILFATLFATYAVLHHSTFGGPTAKELFSLPSSLAETLILLTSSLTSGFAMLAARRNAKNNALFWLTITFLLGAAFLTIELMEFNDLISEGNSWRRSAFLSSFFALVGTHGLHITTGLLWIVVMVSQVFFQGITIDTFRRLLCLNMFWHFLDLVWIFIFTFVYLVGAI